MKRERERSTGKVIFEVVLVILILALLVANGHRAKEREKTLEISRQEVTQAKARVKALEAEKQALLQEIHQLTTTYQDLAREAQEMATILSWESTTMEATHYAPLDPNAVEGVCYQDDPAITASGQRVEVGVTAAAEPGIPFGTRLYIPGYGFRIVQDRGRAITHGRLDIAVDSRKEAFRLGRRQVQVYMEH